MTTLRDLLTDMIHDYYKKRDHLESTMDDGTLTDDDLPNAVDELECNIVDEYVQTIKERWVG